MEIQRCAGERRDGAWAVDVAHRADRVEGGDFRPGAPPYEGGGHVDVPVRVRVHELLRLVQRCLDHVGVRVAVADGVVGAQDVGHITGEVDRYALGAVWSTARWIAASSRSVNASPNRSSADIPSRQ